MKITWWKFKLGAALVAISGVLYLAHYLIFRDLHHIWIYLLGDIAFLPLDVLIVMLLLHRVLQNHERRATMNKLNMIIGAFFSEMGAELIRKLIIHASNAGEMISFLRIGDDWNAARFKTARKVFTAAELQMAGRSRELPGLRDYLASKRSFLLELLGNSNLLEHEEFTDLLWAVTHLAEELAARPRLEKTSESDLNHIRGDMKRVLERLIPVWISYTEHLKTNYPYLFSLAVRTNPLDPDASVEVSG